ncbi:MAG: nuclear transport factor 2 family protein [Flavobacteriaceae bacterium]
MKRSILALIIIIAVVSCKQGPDRWTNKSPEIDMVKALLKDYEDGNWEVWKGHYADTAKIYHNTIEPSSVGEIMEGLRSSLEPVTEYSFSDKDIYYEMIIDDKNQKWVNFWGTWEGNIGALDRDLIIPVHLTLQFVEGKIVEEHGFYNMAEMAAAMSELSSPVEADEPAEE